MEIDDEAKSRRRGLGGELARGDDGRAEKVGDTGDSGRRAEGVGDIGVGLCIAKSPTMSAPSPR